MAKCPVCNEETSVLSPEVLHCGRVRLLSEPEDHYLSFWQLPEDGLPEKGCPICGRPMENIGRFKWVLGKHEGLERMHCCDLDHYVYVTKEWYLQNRC